MMVMAKPPFNRIAAANKIANKKTASLSKSHYFLTDPRSSATLSSKSLMIAFAL